MTMIAPWKPKFKKLLTSLVKSSKSSFKCIGFLRFKTPLNSILILDKNKQLPKLLFKSTVRTDLFDKTDGMPQ